MARFEQFKASVDFWLSINLETLIEFLSIEFGG